MLSLTPETLFAQRYQLVKNIGIGGFSEVWLANDIKANNINVAIKIFAPGKGLDENGLDLFRKEFALVFNLNHTHLLIPRHFDDCNNSPYFVMPFCEKGSVTAKIGKMPILELYEFLFQASSALEYLHGLERPIIHQDIKPDNFLISFDNKYVLTDFGISSAIRRTLTRNAGNINVSGTMAYMPPEKFMAKRQIIIEGDIFSLGVTMFELGSGTLPFYDSGGLLLLQGAEVPDIPDEFDDSLYRIIKSCLSKNPSDRPTASMLKKFAEQYLNSNHQNIINKESLNSFPNIKSIENQIEPNNKNEHPEKKTKKINLINNDTSNEISFDVDTSIVLQLKANNKGKFGFVDQFGKIKISLIYDDAIEFSNDYAAVKKNNKWGFINTKGELKIDFKFTEVYLDFYQDIAYVRFEEKDVWIDKNGNIVNI